MKGEKVALAQRAAQYQRADNGCLHTFKDSWVIHESLFLYGIPSIGVVTQKPLVCSSKRFLPTFLCIYKKARILQHNKMEMRPFAYNMLIFQLGGKSKHEQGI